MAGVVTSPAARRDLIEHYVYLAENGGDEIADRFLVNTEASVNGLMEYPEMGAPMSLRRPELAGLRRWQVKDFENFLLFYIPRKDGIFVVRVLHAARDWWDLFRVDP